MSRRALAAAVRDKGSGRPHTALAYRLASPDRLAIWTVIAPARWRLASWPPGCAAGGAGGSG